MAGLLLLLLCFGVTLLSVSSAKIGGYNTAPNTQYHIQTDEGPERYFRYQTISGQYRKEKRLQDGTVVGTYGWVDSNGFLRLRDYIADNKGYRIVRTKMVNVGVDTPIATAVSAAKKVPSQGGVGVHNANIYQPVKHIQVSTTPNSIPSYPSTTKSPISLSEYLKQNQNSVSYQTTPSPVPSSSYIPSQPEVVITPNSYYQPSSVPSYSNSIYHTTTPVPYYESSTPVPPRTFRPYYNPNSLQNYYSADSANRRVYDTVGAQRYESGNSGGSDYPQYDGVAMTHNGFRYYLPRHYHEEETLPNEKRAGSFGYIDPFGIRRVIYYNASPGSGFVHRKNNRYVGFNATPYDPRY